MDMKQMNVNRSDMKTQTHCTQPYSGPFPLSFLRPTTSTPKLPHQHINTKTYIPDAELAPLLVELIVVGGEMVLVAMVGVGVGIMVGVAVGTAVVALGGKGVEVGTGGVVVVVLVVVVLVVVVPESGVVLGGVVVIVLVTLASTKT